MSAPASVICIVPGLIWPATGLSDALSALALPGLSALLARANMRDEAPRSLDVWLVNQFGLSGDIPFAALRLAGEQDDVPDKAALWVCADPVSLRFARQHLLLDAPETLELDADEIAALLADLNKTFADIGKFHSSTPEHVYLTLNAEHADKHAVTLAPLADVESRPIAQFQARGEQAAWWSKLANDLQVFCHNHPVNTAREARRAPALNALWLWGLGRLPDRLTPPTPNIATQLQHPHPLLTGLARLAQGPLQRFDPHRPAAWSLLDALYVPAQQRDAVSWVQALRTMDENVFVPLSQQLRDGKIAHLRIVAPGDTALTSFDISPTPRWQFWQRGASKTQLIALLGRPST